jgi:aminoglycoside 6'-N-acetyltransferase I
MVTRRVEEKDFQKWLEMRYDLWSYHTLEELEEEMKGIYDNIELNPVYVAEDNSGNKLGFIELSIHKKAPGCTTTNIGFIEGWYVKPQYRHTGVGRMLVEQGEQWAINIGCQEMASDTNSRYPISSIAHKALGYEEVDIPLNFRKIIV